MIEALYLALQIAGHEIEDAVVLHCRPLAPILHQLEKAKYKETYGTPIRIEDAHGLEVVRDLYGHMTQDKDDEDEPPKWTLAVVVPQKDEGAVLMLGFTVKPEDLKDEKDPDAEVPKEAIEGMCKTLRLSANMWKALNTELYVSKT